MADAVVKDEGQTHAGHDAILRGGASAKAKYRHVSSRSRSPSEGDVRTVHARVTGQFPGSPAILTFAFRLEGDKITSLEIGA